MTAFRALLVLGVLLPVLLPSSPASAQEGGVFVGLGAHLARGSMSVGRDDASATGLSVTGQVGTARAGYRRWLVELDAQLFETPSPVLDERYRAVSVLVRRSLGRDLFLAPGAGVQYRSWSGPERVESSDVGVVLGASAGVRVIVGGWSVLPEISFLWSPIETQGSVGGSTLRIGANVMRVLSGS